MALEGKASGMFYRYPCYLGFLAWPRYSGKLLFFFSPLLKEKPLCPFLQVHTVLSFCGLACLPFRSKYLADLQ